MIFWPTEIVSGSLIQKRELADSSIRRELTVRTNILAELSLASLLRAHSLPEMRMPPAEMRGSTVDGNQIGSSGLAGVHTKMFSATRPSGILFDPAVRAGAYDGSWAFAPR